MALVKEHTPGTVRYWHYFLDFPDGDHWQDSIAFVNDLDFEIKKILLADKSKAKPAGFGRDILQKGECSWNVHHPNGTVKHTMKVMDIPCQRIWGSTQGNIRRAIEKDKQIDKETVKRIEEGEVN